MTLKITAIEDQRNGILTTLNNGYEYFIPKNDFNLLHGDGISGWIDQLSEKTWSDIDSLYKVASIMSKYIKNSEIDWHKTFFQMERYYMVKHVVDKDEKLDETNLPWKSQKAYVERTFKMIEIGRLTNTVEINEKVRDTVQSSIDKSFFRV